MNLFRSITLSLLTFAGTTLAAEPVTCLVEAESFQYSGQWGRESDSGASGGKFLFTMASSADALTVVDLPSAGKYSLWTRARDFAKLQSGSRRFTLVIDGVAAEKESGQHGKDGWAWEKVGVMDLSAGEHVICLRDTTKFFPRCDAILFTTGDFDPNSVPVKDLKKHTLQPRAVKARQGNEFPSPRPVDKTQLQEVAHIQNDLVRIAFNKVTDANGSKRIVRETQLHIAGEWKKLPLDPAGESLFLLYNASSGLNQGSILPSWANGKSELVVEIGGKSYVTAAGGNNPYLAGESTLLTARNVRAIDSSTVEVEFDAPSGLKASGRWTLIPGRSDAKFTLTFTAEKSGEYSAGFCAFAPHEKDATQFAILPPLFQFQRFPASPRMVTSAVTSHPMSAVQVAVEGLNTPVTLAVVADPHALQFEWPTAINSRYGFTIQNPLGKPQPAIFSPVLGYSDSLLTAGQSKTVSFHVLAHAGDWKSALEYESKQIFNVADYRQPTGASLSTAAMNMIDLLKDDQSSGWDAQLKGYYNIESPSTVTHAAPLMVVSAAVLSRDEDLYVKRALPTIEYVLTRPSAHFSLTEPDSHPVYVREEDTRFKIPSDFFGTSYWQGLNELLGNANPWIKDLALQRSGEPRHRASYSSMPKWSEMLAAYRLNPNSEQLKKVEQAADEYIQKEIYGKQKTEINLTAFYNISFYPYWWDLLDLYEITRNPKYLSAAEEGGFHTMAGQWVHPMIPAGEVKVHPGGEFNNDARVWWKAGEDYRLGWPRKAGDAPEHMAPAWTVSQIGLGFEQPSTYFAGGGKTSPGHRNIMMSAWAPNLLRLYGHTGREIYQTYARNSIIGRFANYPGYYLAGLTDLQFAPDYPQKGPDVTSIYYHHIPPHLAFTVDFLVTQANVRSKGAINFPWVKQQGYVWFTNRIYGTQPGKIFSDNTVELRFDKKLAAVDFDKIDLLQARGKDRLWVVLMNQSDAEQTVAVKIDQTLARLKSDQPYEVYNVDGTLLGKGIAPKVPAKGLIAIAYPAEVQSQQALPQVINGHQEQELAGDWKQLHAFRIRSPFGKDSLYVALIGRPAEGSAKLLVEGREPIEVKNFPYEFSVYPIPMDQDLSFTLELKDAKGSITHSQPMTFKGTR